MRKTQRKVTETVRMPGIGISRFCIQSSVAVPQHIVQNAGSGRPMPVSMHHINCEVSCPIFFEAERHLRRRRPSTCLRCLSAVTVPSCYVTLYVDEAEG